MQDKATPRVYLLVGSLLFAAVAVGSLRGDLAGHDGLALSKAGGYAYAIGCAAGGIVLFIMYLRAPRSR